ncbi:penicillin acylase family protein [Reichenbachiella carrageenanivorans]|uniref:Penicillin acylase family protein n=1 Tax=Reichenbachiella carrageenanivorans TaxID=2979869 RepID=A0ABY6D3L9_9BACT|nr:penicillin acylase family protein [Reichenbachiella carrageenanivorans]UXX80374.1 penicillin acylase family protein [Reichenbachiella carrageenanivorans]
MLKKTLTILLVFVLIGVATFWYLQSLKPQYSGEVSLPGLTSEATIYYDDFGIPHIYADNEVDAYRTLGYAHAQDRLWQMEVVRRIAPGRLSEIFGSKLLKVDKLFRAMGLQQYSEQTLVEFEAHGDPKIKAAAQAYLAGINAFIDQGPTPIEFTLVGVDKTPFSLIDVYNTMGYMSFSFAAAQKTEPIVTRILQEYGADYLNDLDVAIHPTNTRMKSFVAASSMDQMALRIDQILLDLPAAPMIGSNSWVLGGKKTKSGKVILANDPHIGFSQPAVWYEAHIETPETSFYGYYLAGYPFAIMGHNRQYATGLTMFENDDIDLYFEKTNPDNPNEYLYKEEARPYEVRQERIIVKDSTAVEMSIKHTHHGPVMNEALALDDNWPPVSLYWVYTQKSGKILEVTYNFSHIKNFTDMRNTVAQIHGPGLNVMYGDHQNNYARWSSAHLMKRAKGVNSKLILDGQSGANDVLGFYDFTYNPKAENTPWGYVYSANNQTDTTKGLLVPGYYLPEDRARRIDHLLSEDKRWDVEDTKQMMLDVTSENSPEVVASILAAIDDKLVNSENEEEAIHLLGNWEGNYPLDGIAPTIYNKLIYKIQEGIFMNKLGAEGFDIYMKTHLMKRSYQLLFANDSSRWWDNPHTPEIETRSQIITTAFTDGLIELEKQLGKDMSQWTWGRVHTLEHGHVLGAVELLRKFFNVGPFAVPGNNEVINNYIYRWTADGQYKTLAGPSTRRIVDFADVEGNSWSILPTGNSGNVLSPHYADQAEMYVKGEYRRQLMNKEEIMQQAGQPLALRPE